MPVLLGMPGPVERTKLLAMATKIGVGESTRFLAKHKGTFARLAAPGGFTGERFLEKCAPAAARARCARRGAARLHVQPDRRDRGVALGPAGSAPTLISPYHLVTPATGVRHSVTCRGLQRPTSDRTPGQPGIATSPGRMVATGRDALDCSVSFGSLSCLAVNRWTMRSVAQRAKWSSPIVRTLVASRIRLLTSVRTSSAALPCARPPNGAAQVSKTRVRGARPRWPRCRPVRPGPSRPTRAHLLEGRRTSRPGS